MQRAGAAFPRVLAPQSDPTRGHELSALKRCTSRGIPPPTESAGALCGNQRCIITLGPRTGLCGLVQIVHVFRGLHHL